MIALDLGSHTFRSARLLGGSLRTRRVRAEYCPVLDNRIHRVDRRAAGGTAVPPEGISCSMGARLTYRSAALPQQRYARNGRCGGKAHARRFAHSSCMKIAGCTERGCGRRRAAERAGGVPRLGRARRGGGAPAGDGLRPLRRRHRPQPGGAASGPGRSRRDGVRPSRVRRSARGVGAARPEHAALAIDPRRRDPRVVSRRASRRG